MSKPTTIREAIKKWEEKYGKNPSMETEIGLQFQWPPIEKIDGSLSQLGKCEKLSLSTNMIEKIGGLGHMKNLKTLSLGRNYIKSFSGLLFINDDLLSPQCSKEPVADTLEELWISYNFIDKMKGIGVLRKLKVLYMSNNLIKDWGEYQKLQECPELKELLFTGNPLCEGLEEPVWRTEATRRLPQLENLDGEPVIHEISS